MGMICDRIVEGGGYSAVDTSYFAETKEVIPILTHEQIIDMAKRITPNIPDANINATLSDRDADLVRLGVMLGAAADIPLSTWNALHEQGFIADVTPKETAVSTFVSIALATLRSIADPPSNAGKGSS